MDKQEETSFLFTIAKEIKHSFESPVILLTKNDYAEIIFKSLVDIKTALLEEAPKKDVFDIICTFHLEWLKAVQDMETFKKNAIGMPREVIYDAIDYTTKCVDKRLEYFQSYIKCLKTSMAKEQESLMQGDLGIINDMRELVNYALQDKRRSLQYQADRSDFYIVIMNEIEELMCWLDKLNNNIAIQFSKLLNIPSHPYELTKALQRVIDNVAIEQNTDITANEFCMRDESRNASMRASSLNDLQIEKISDKIKNLENRINRLKIDRSSEVTALEHKTLYLEDRLRSLENLKLSLNSLQNQKVISKSADIIDDEDYSVFNHLLPKAQRCRLVENLLQLWNNVIGVNKKSMISILSPADLKEVFSDEIGHFHVDVYGRKIYTKENDNRLFQLNENNELVEVRDDKKFVYYYDECGRYYLDENRERVYKMHSVASEYVLNKSGLLLKLSEVDNGVVYYYNNLGRYYINAAGDHIYKDKGSNEEYKEDGLGNLVRIRSVESDFVLCPREPMVMEENLYLKHAVGDALKRCLAEVIMMQPPNPVTYLADRLVKYRSSMEYRQTHKEELEELEQARKEYQEKEEMLNPPVPDDTVVGYEDESTVDLNFVGYQSDFGI